jgi:hypothetical protein
MLADLPLSTVIVEIVRHTPAYVWAILAALVALGALQLRDRRIPRIRLAIAPIALGAYSLWGATAAFGVHAGVIGAWLAGIALAFAANRRLQWPRRPRPDGADGFALEGSAWPLVLMLVVFCLRYAVAVTLVFHPGWAAEPGFGGSLALAYGALSGLFAARAVRILGSAAPQGSLARA